MKKVYTEEFKRQAVELAASLGSGVAAARQLGISNSNLYAWKCRFKQSNLDKKNSDLPPAEAEEITRLRRENAELKKVNHILKSAAAFFSQDHLK